MNLLHLLYRSIKIILICTTCYRKHLTQSPTKLKLISKKKHRLGTSAAKQLQTTRDFGGMSDVFPRTQYTFISMYRADVLCPLEGHTIQNNYFLLANFCVPLLGKHNKNNTEHISLIFTYAYLVKIYFGLQHNHIYYWILRCFSSP